MRPALCLAAIVLTIAATAPARAARYPHSWRTRVVHRQRAYHIPRFNPAEAEAEVHTIYRYRTPYAYPAVFGPFY